MTLLLEKEINKLKKMLLALSAIVEESLYNGVKALVDRDLDLARKVIEDDTRVDEAEVELEEEGLKILALHQPMAIDLRFIVSVLRINSDLERIGSIAVRSETGDLRFAFYRLAVESGSGVLNWRDELSANDSGSYMASTLAGGATARPAEVTRAR